MLGILLKKFLQPGRLSNLHLFKLLGDLTHYGHLPVWSGGRKLPKELEYPMRGFIQDDCPPFGPNLLKGRLPALLMGKKAHEAERVSWHPRYRERRSDSRRPGDCFDSEAIAERLTHSCDEPISRVADAGRARVGAVCNLLAEHEPVNDLFG